MSWNFSVSAKSLDELEGALEEASQSSRSSDENIDQVDAAIEAALSIAHSNSIGSETKKFNVTLGGHSNPGHEPKSGMSNDQINVNVYQASEPA